MEWYGDRASQDEAKKTTERVLTVTSGNVQPFSSNSKHSAVKHHQSDASRTQPWQPKLEYPTPTVTLRSNDRRALIRQKLYVRRLKRRVHLAQAYLQHPKFLNFKTRARKDVVKGTGEVIWDEETEAAFQNALINIPAMGRKKKSQHGKTLGRNELIAEWIKHETGRHRCRKQISSHLQTLEGLFKPKLESGFLGIPEWRIINKVSDETTTELDGPDFYENSIADLVVCWRAFQNDVSNYDGTTERIAAPQPAYLQSRSDKIGSLKWLNFEMWVGHPGKVSESLHRYTRIMPQQEIDNSDVMETTLEDIEGWRSSWPGLVPLLEEQDDFDIILLASTIELMPDFPPRGSRLGIILDLGFAPAHTEGFMSYENTHWHCNTYIYQRGREELKFEHHGCHTGGSGTVKPPFESKWWAELFTRLTEKRQHAIDSKNDAAIAIADEAARNCLGNLKIMQEIFMESSDSNQTSTNSKHHPKPQQRVAVLLWDFEQTLPRYFGLTTWQRLLRPPSRDSINSPLPSSEQTMLPPLHLDSMIETNADDNEFESHNGFLPPLPHLAEASYASDTDEEICQDGYMMVSQPNHLNLAEVPSNQSSSLRFFNYDYHNQNAFQHNTDLIAAQAYDSFAADFQTSYSNSYFETSDQIQQTNSQSYMSNQNLFDHQVHTAPGSSPNRRRQALLTFDVNTHTMLQAQLHDLDPAEDHPGKHQTRSSPTYQHTQLLTQHPTDTESRKTKINSTSHEDAIEENAMSNVFSSDININIDTAATSQQYQNERHSDDLVTEIHDSDIVAPTAVRPHLHHHHSFAGILPPQSHSQFRMDETFNHASLSFDEMNSRHHYGLLLCHPENQHEDFYNSSNHYLSTIESSGNINGAGLGILRSHSLPPPVVCAPEDDIQGTPLVSDIVDADPAENEDNTNDEVVGEIHGHANPTVQNAHDLSKTQNQNDDENGWVDVKVEVELD